MFRYQAPNPYAHPTFFSWLFSFSSSQSVGKVVLPAQFREPKTISENSLKQFAEINGLSIKPGIIETFDNAFLDTVEIKPDTQDSRKPHFIIKFNGNGMLWQDAIGDYANDALKLGVTVISFNYRGVGKSTKAPSTFQDLVTDGIAQVQRLLDQGVDSKEITLDGLSLGGGVATMVASHFHHINKPVYLWNDRSFASISKAAAGMVAPEAINILSTKLNTSIELTSSSLMNTTGWDTNVAKAYNNIPAEYKNHMFVAKKSDRSFGDGIISHRASLHRGVKCYEQENNISTGHKMYATNGVFGGGHNMARTDLVCALQPEITSQDVFETFVKKHTC